MESESVGKSSRETHRNLLQEQDQLSSHLREVHQPARDEAEVPTRSPRDEVAYARTDTFIAWPGGGGAAAPAEDTGQPHPQRPDWLPR